MSEKKEFSTYLANVNDAYMGLIERQMSDNRIEFSDYSKKCVMNAIGTINQVLDKEGINFNSKELDQSNVTNILLNVAYLELNSIAQPSECYFQIRNVKKKDESYVKMIEFGIQSDGYDAILSRFGRGVKKVYPYWLVRSNDKFVYPKYNGLSYEPPQWEPQGSGEVVRIVYPVLHTDDTLHFYIGERDDVLKNLLAHINNNMMNETFGIAKSRFNATPAQLAQINEKKSYLKEKAKKEGFGALDDAELAPYISPSWKEDFSRESMIIRKIRNNIVKKIPKDFGNPAIFESYSEASSDEYAKTKQTIVENTAIYDVTPIDPQEGADAPQRGALTEGDREDGQNTNAAQSGNMEALGEGVDNRVKPNFD